MKARYRLQYLETLERTKIIIFRIIGFVDCVHRPEFSVTTKSNVSDTGFVSVFRQGGGVTRTLFGPLERANLSHWDQVV
jgi:hypothetical protein